MTSCFTLRVFLTILCLASHSMSDPADVSCPPIDELKNNLLLPWEQTTCIDMPILTEYHGTSKPHSLCSVTNEIAHCDNRQLSEIPQDLPSNIKFLSLQNNSFSHIQNGSFSRYQQLIGIDLSRNQITQLYSNSFQGLYNLKCLNLWYNKLAYKESNFPLGVFQPFNRSLKVLVMSFNNPDPTLNYLHYPVNELSRLSSLTSLYMDGLMYPMFGPGFQNMTSLTVLYLSGYKHGHCHIDGLDRHTFDNVSQVKCLYMNDCFIQGSNVHSDTLRPLKHLVTLDLTHNEDITIEHFVNITSGLKNTTSLRYLGFHLVVPRYNMGICLSKRHVEFLPPSVEYIDAQENSLEAVRKDLISALPKSLKKLDLSGNHFVFGSYLEDLDKMENLEILKLNGGTFIYEIPKNYPFHPLYYKRANSPFVSSISTSKESCLYEGFTEKKNTKLILKLPPKLNILEMENAGLAYRLTELNIDSNNSLEILNLTHNRFFTLEGPLRGLNKLKKLDLSWSFVNDLNESFFQNFQSLEWLNLQANYLRLFFNSKRSSKVFSNLTNLKYLDLSFSVIENFHEGVFKDLNNLEVLRLDRNLITSFNNCDISHMTNLRFLNLSNTHIATLHPLTRNAIDNLMARNISFHIDMTWTPISCDCDNLQFLEWMAKSKAFDKNFKNYRCDFHDLILVNLIDGYEETLMRLRRECTPHVYLLLVVTLCVSVTLILIGASICYRFRWNLKYLYHVAYLHYKKDGKHRSKEFEFDAFICYANEDQDFVSNVVEEELKQRGLDVLVHGRDFVAGEFISTNIVGAVCRSRKTLVVLSPHMIKSSWCNYEIQMANMEAIHTGRKVLIFLLKGTIGKSQVNLDVYYNIKSNTYLELPPSEQCDEEQMRALWDKLASDIEQ